MIYEHFNMRLHASEYEQQEPSSWVIRTGDGVLNAFSVGSIVNPKPMVKKNSLDISGASGEIDLTEESGRVFFENKTVTVILQGRADLNGMDEVESFFSAYQGRLMDFTTDNYLAVSGFQVGRMAAEIDRKKNRVTLTFDTQPYRYSEIVNEKQLSIRQNYEVSINTDAWTLTGGYGGDLLYEDDQKTSFTFGFSNEGAELYREKYIPDVKGVLALGIREIVGGEIWFETVDGGKSKTAAEVIRLTSPVDGKPGVIRMTIKCDGSYYEWKTVNGNRRYIPVVRCEYVLTSFLPQDETTGELDSSVTVDMPSNVTVRPYVRVLSATTYVISDGVISTQEVRQNYEQKAKVMLPNIRADLSGETVKSIVCAVAQSAYSSPTVSIRYRDAEVF